MENLAINCRRVKKVLVEFIRKRIENSGFQRAVLGLSGGIDSTVVAYLAVEALGDPHKVYALILPYKSYQSESVKDARLVAKKLRINSQIIRIDSMVEEYFRKFSYKGIPHHALPGSDASQVKRLEYVRRGNKMARERMSILYDWALSLRALVLGTSNKTELSMGYFTKYGDGGVDLEPLGDLYKTQVRQLAKYLGVSEKIINRRPSAGLWPGQTDEGELGINYEELDKILCCMLEKKHSIKKLLTLGFSLENIEKIKNFVERSEHKRRLPPVAKVR
ncbi:MAG: NAD+ synthase [Elusimicrobiota bacterium]|nr:NAD+ synthase [Elusimicrobiota bacterium]